MKNIGIVIPDINFIGGAESVAINLAMNLDSHNYKVKLISLFSHASNKTYPVEVLNLGLQKGSRVKYFINRFFLMSKLLARVDDLDYVIGNNFFRYYAFPIAKNNAKLIEIHHFNYFDGIYPPSLRMKLAIKVRNYLYSKLHLVVTLTKPTARLFNEAGVINTFTIPNGLSFYPDNGSKLESKKVVAIGRLTWQKGFQDLVSIWKIVSKYRPDWKLELYGTGPLKNELYELIQSEGLDNTFLLMGTTNNIMKELSTASICVMTSKYEGFPMTLLEALSAGVPCISYNCDSGPSEIIINGEDGVIIAPGDINQFAEHLLEIMNNNYLRRKMGTKARENIKRYNWDEIISLWKQILV